MNYTQQLLKQSNFTFTNNGMPCLKSTNNSLLDFFTTLSYLRYEREEDIIRVFMSGYDDNPLLALKALFYARNIRGLGQGERRISRVIFNYLAKHRTKHMRVNINLVVLFGRIDDLYSFVGTPLEIDAFNILKTMAFSDDKKNSDFTLVGKWLKSANSKSKETRELGLKTAFHFGLSEKEYRKLLSRLRSKIDIVESKVCDCSFDKIDYSKVSSYAMMKYRYLFFKKDEERFKSYIDSLTKGETKINASVLYPYDIFESIGMTDTSKKIRSISKEQVDLAQAQWNELPNYIDGPKEVLVVADTSDSMWGRPFATALSLAVYLAERNLGVWKDKFITFSSEPSFHELKGNNIVEKLIGVKCIVDNTDIEKVFNLILETAINSDLEPESMVKSIMIISDMHFDGGQVKNSSKSHIENMKDKFSSHGYILPEVIYWNVASSVQHTLSDEAGVKLYSGSSPSIMQKALNGEVSTPLEAMLEVLNDPIFDVVTI